MIIYITYSYIKSLIKRARGHIFNFIITNKFSVSKKISIGKNFQIVKGKSTKIILGNNLNIGCNVEIRVYDNSSLFIGDNVKIDDGVRIISANSCVVKIGNHSKLGYYSVLNGGGGIEIGDNCSTYGFVYFQSSVHNTNKEGFSKSIYSHHKIKINDNTLIGPFEILSPGSELKKGSIKSKIKNLNG